MSTKTKQMEALAIIELLILGIEKLLPYLPKDRGSVAKQKALAEFIATLRTKLFDSEQWKPSRRKK